MNLDKKIKLLVLDIDGTIMNSSHEVSDRIAKSISKAMDLGIKVVLATGRMYSATIPIAANLGITTPLITYQGSLIREFYESDDILLHYTIPPNLSKEVIQELDNFGMQINVYLNDEMFIRNESDILVEYAKKRHIIYHKIDSFDEVIELKPTKILGLNTNPDKTTKLRDTLRESFSDSLNITKSTTTYCEIVNNKASKAKAVLFLAERLNIHPSEIMAIGDQENDKDMLEMAGLSIAMGNSPDELKKIANYVTDTVNNDGAALAIEKFILGETNNATI